MFFSGIFSFYENVEKKNGLNFTAVHGLCEVGKRMRVLRGRRLRGRRTGVHILRCAHERRLSGAQRVRVSRQRARRREDQIRRVPFRPAVRASAPTVADALAARLGRVPPDARPVPHRRQTTGVRTHFQHGPEYVPPSYTCARMTFANAVNAFSAKKNSFFFLYRPSDIRRLFFFF